jgi:hypothetical protein
MTNQPCQSAFCRPLSAVGKDHRADRYSLQKMRSIGALMKVLWQVASKDGIRDCH